MERNEQIKKRLLLGKLFLQKRYFFTIFWNYENRKIALKALFCDL